MTKLTNRGLQIYHSGWAEGTPLMTNVPADDHEEPHLYPAGTVAETPMIKEELRK